MSSPEDEHPVQALSPDRPDPPFGEGIRPGRPDGRQDDLDALGAEHFIEEAGTIAMSQMMRSQTPDMHIDVHDAIAATR